MTLKVIGFYRRTKNKNPFTTSLVDPVFYVLVCRNKKVKEFTLKLLGKFSYLTYDTPKGFDVDAYRNYSVITDFLLGKYRDTIRANWGLTRKEYRDLIFQMYFVLVKNHTNISLAKKVFLVLAGFIKYYLGGKRV